MREEFVHQIMRSEPDTRHCPDCDEFVMPIVESSDIEKIRVRCPVCEDRDVIPQAYD